MALARQVSAPTSKTDHSCGTRFSNGFSGGRSPNKVADGTRGKIPARKL
jgi:hypothetical protein